MAAIVVVFNHLMATCLLNEQQLLYGYINDWNISFIFKDFVINTINLFLDGGLAVWIFWVLSSYVISILFFKKDENYDRILIGYFSKRYFRLFAPVFFSIMVAYLLLKSGFMYNIELAAVLGVPYKNGWLNSFYNFEPDFFKAVVSGIYSSAFNYELESTYNAVLWTIQNEFLGSLFTFSVFGIIRHNSRRFLLYFVITVVLLKLQLLWLVAFVIGHVLCDYDFSEMNNRYINYLKKIEHEIHKHTFIIAISSVLFIVFGGQLLSFLKIPEGYHKLALSIFIVYICLRNQHYQSAFSSGVPFWLGKLSYALYLIHLPVLCSFTSYMVLVNNTFQGKLIATLITLPVVLMLSWFFTKYIDRKSIIYANKVGDYFKEGS